MMNVTVNVAVKEFGPYNYGVYVNDWLVGSYAYRDAAERDAAAVLTASRKGRN